MEPNVVFHLCSRFGSSGRLRKQRRPREETPVHQGGRGGLGFRGGTLAPPEDARPVPAEPRPAVTHALPNALAYTLAAAADERCPVTRRLHAAHQSADTHGQLHLPAARPQPAVRANKPF